MQKKSRIPCKLFLAAAAVALLLSCLGLIAFAAEPEWQPLTNGGKLSSGYYRLESDITLTENITIESKANVTIDLNGYTLKGTGNGSVITASSGSTITIDDLSELKAGRITGGVATNGGAINASEASVIINNGTLCGNQATRHGGAIYAKNLTINGGVIGDIDAVVHWSDETKTQYPSLPTKTEIYIKSISAEQGNAATKNGGAAYISGTLQINGGVIVGNRANQGGAFFFDSKAGAEMDNGIVYGNDATSNGGAVRSNTGSWIDLQGVRFHCNCTGTYGAAFDVSGNLTVGEGAVISYNTAKNNGGAITVESGSTTTINAGIISNNYALGNGGAFRCVGNLIINGGEITYNFAKTGGAISARTDQPEGAQAVRVASVQLNGGMIAYNNASVKAGGIEIEIRNVTEDIHVSFNGTSFDKNTAKGDGGAAYIHANSGQIYVDLKAGSLSENSADNGGGLYVIPGTNAKAFITVSGETKISDNKAKTSGGGIYVSNGNVTLSGGSLKGNSATNGGGVYVNGGDVTVTGGNIEYNEAQNGGGVYLTGGAFTLNGDSTSINNNNATNGGGVYLTKINPTLLQGSITENTATENGGAIFIDQQIVKLQPTGAVQITKNQAQNGAGLYINGTVGKDDAGFSVDASLGGTVTLTDNIASENGGGVYVNNGFFTMETDHLVLQKNGAQNGGAVYVNGGNATLSVGTVDQNTASQNGGGIYVNGGSVELSGATVTGNTATENGGGIAVSNGNMTMLGGKVDRNHAVNGSGGGIYVTTTGNTTVKIQSGSISYNQNNIFGGALAVYGGDTGTITITIGLNELHPCDHNEKDGINEDDSCPVIKDNTVAMEGGAIYIKGGSQTILGIYCLVESGNRAGGLAAGSEKTTLNDFMMVRGGTVEVSSADPQNRENYGYGFSSIEGSIHVTAGKVDLWGSMLNPFIKAPITVDIEGEEDHFIDHRQNEEGKIKWYKIHYYENFEKNGVTTGRYTAFAVSSEEKHQVLPALYTHEGYSITSWNIVPKPTNDNKGHEYAVGSELSFENPNLLVGFNAETGTLVLYALWSDNTYKIIYEPNAPSYEGNMQATTYPCTSNTQLIKNEYFRELYVFLGWGTTTDQTKPTYFDEASIQPLSIEDGDVVILYAIWGSCTHEKMEITSSDNKTDTHTPTLTYSAAGATLTVTCSCAYCESATLHAENAIYDGNPHTASVTYTHGVLLKDLEIVYVYAIPGEVDLSDGEAQNHNEYRYAGTYTATIAKGGESASLTYVIERAPQAAPSEKPAYSVVDNTLQVTTVYATGESGEAVQYSLYVDITSWKITWGSSAVMTFDAAWTTYYAQVRYPGNRNYLPSDVVRSDLKHFYKGKVSISIVTDAGMIPSVQETTDSLQIIIDLLSGYYYSNLTHTIDSSGFTGYTLELGETVNGDRRTYTPKTPIPDTEGATITITFQGTVKKATASAMVKPGEVFSAITSTVETKIARDSAFTVNFRIEDYANYSNLTLTFGEQSLPIGTTVILKDLTDGTYWWMKLESPSQSIPLTSFQKMGTDEKFADPTAKTLHYQFVIDFSDVTGGCTEDDLTVSLTATPSGNAPELKPSASVTLKAISFSVEKQTEEVDAQENVDVTFAQTEGTASKWDSLTGYLLLTPTGGQDLPPDLVLRVTQGDATVLYQRNAEGFFAVKLTNGKSNLTLSLESEMFPDGGATYSFSATLHATAVHDAPRSDVIAGPRADLTFTIPAKTAEPMAKLTGDRRVYAEGDTISLQMALYLGEAEQFQFTVKLLYKTESGRYSDTLIPVAIGNDGSTLTAGLSGLESGSYCVRLTVTNEGTTVLTVPYYFVIE